MSSEYEQLIDKLQSSVRRQVTQPLMERKAGLDSTISFPLIEASIARAMHAMYELGKRSENDRINAKIEEFCQSLEGYKARLYVKRDNA